MSSSSRLQVTANAQLAAGGGNLTLQNLNTLSGAITLNDHSFLTAGGIGSTAGNVFIVIADGASANLSIQHVLPAS